MMAMMVSETGGLAIGQTALMGQKWLVTADSQEFNLEDEGRVGRNICRAAFRAAALFSVSEVVRDIEHDVAAGVDFLQALAKTGHYR